MNRIIILFLACAILLTGCTAPVSSAPKATAQWIESARLEAEETPEELCEKAKSEGILVVYTVSTRMMDVAKSFEQHYPGFTVKVYDLRADELVERVKRNAGNGDCDLILCTDVDGALSLGLIPQGLAVKYTPYDIAPAMLPGYDEEILSIMGELIVIGYNGALHETSPVSNWWELTEPQWRGKVYAPNPAKSVTTLAAISMMFQHEEQLEAAYLARYGVAFTAENGEGAAKTYVRRLLENGLHIVNSSDETADAIGAPGKVEDNLGIIVSSKIRLNDIGYTIAHCYEAVPVGGFANPVNIMLASGSKNVSSAKLFIRWILGEANGSGEGAQPYRQNGTWPTRRDVPSPSAVSLEELELILTDGAYVFEHRQEILAFWESVLSAQS